MRQVHGGMAAALGLVLAAIGCSDTATCASAACHNGAAAGPTSFETDLADATSATPGAASGTLAPTSGKSTPASATDASRDAAERAISEADVIQVQGDRLYALSRISGLAIIDVSQPRALKLMGRYRELPATPFELYVRGDVALVMFSGWGQYLPESDSTVWVTTSKLLALDVADATNVQQLGSFDIPGAINDSRVVGDILYVVSRQDGACWRCIQNRQLTSITSLNIANPREVKKVDELDYDDGSASWGPRSVTVTQLRMYVSGPTYGSNMPTDSTIQVVDISDPSGDLVEGTSVQVAGQVQSRWQMDEYQGVLRVVSQPWTSRNAAESRPAVQTFRVESSQKLSALGRTEIQLPMPESLRSVRFDGARGYAITAEQTDPLFTLDLSDPDKPRQVGQLALPGFITHMEPRGERLIGLGFDRANPEGAIAVSLFDVKDLNAPKLLSRVSFGGQSGQLPADQDRLHKVFRVLSDEGLILVPFSAWKQVELPGTCPAGESAGGVQLIDLDHDVLKARGVAKSVGETRRALLAQGQLITVGDERVQAFDLANRDAPAELSKIVLSRFTQSARALENGAVVRIDIDGSMRFDLVDESGVMDANQSLAELDLSQEIEGKLDNCSSGMALRGTFIHGNRIEVLYAGWSFGDRGPKDSRQGLVIVDASNPSQPKLVSNTVWSTGDEVWTPSAGISDYGEIADLGHAAAIVTTPDTISVLEHFWPGGDSAAPHQARLRVIDVRDPAHVTTTTAPLTSGSQYAGLVVADNVVMTSHFETTSATGTHGRFYLDRVDISNPGAPTTLPKVNVPGVLVGFDVRTQRAITSQQTRTPGSDLTVEACYARFAMADWKTDQVATGANPPVPKPDGSSMSASGLQPVASGPGKCVGYVQHLQLVRLSADGAVLEDTYVLPESQQVSSSSQGDGVLFALTTHSGHDARELLVLGGFDKGTLDVGLITIKGEENRWFGPWNVSNLHAAGKRALLLGSREGAIIDATDVLHPSIQKRVPLIGMAQGLDMHGEQALLSAGELGVQVIDFD